jgi:hypothetical protein
MQLPLADRPRGLRTQSKAEMIPVVHSASETRCCGSRSRSLAEILEPGLCPAAEPSAALVFRLTGLQPSLIGRKCLGAPLGEISGRDSEFPADGGGVLASEEPQDELGLAPVGPASFAGPIASCGCARATRSYLRRRSLASWIPCDDAHVASFPAPMSQKTLQRTNPTPTTPAGMGIVTVSGAPDRFRGKSRPNGMQVRRRTNRSQGREQATSRF